jgi:hypothetical protein
MDIFDLDDDLPDFVPIGGAPEGNIVAPAAMIVGEEQGMTLREYEREQGELDRHAQLLTLQDQLFAEHMKVMRDIGMSREINPDDPAIPDEWLQRFGQEEATKMHRVAVAGWQNKKDAPCFVDVSKSVVLGIIRAKATEKTGPRQLNVNVVNMTAPPMVFPEMEVGNE